jgi:hypothetical protein
MAWGNFDREFIDYGAVIVNGNLVKVHSSSQFGININVGQEVDRAYWSGNHIIVVLNNGKIRRYNGFQDYDVVS